ncbi:branched-chain amino acid aminotransferase [Streptomyces albidoflavus]
MSPSNPAGVEMHEFGEFFTAHMVTSEWGVGKGWGPLELGPHVPMSISPSMVGLHYGQVVFEGLKAYRQADGSVGSFRARAHASRLTDSARRLVIPPLPEPMFLEAVDLLTAADQDSLPNDVGSGLSLYLRPLLFASDSSLALRPARSYRFVLIAFVTEGFFADEPDAIPVWVSPDQTRAFPGGTGSVKFAGNYAPTYRAQEEARMAGCRQVVWLDAIERRWIEELGGMNIFFVRGAGSTPQVVTPPLGGTLLPGVTRDTLLYLSGRLGYEPREERVTIGQWQEECSEGIITETFASGTAAAVTPVGAVRYRDWEWNVGTGKTGPVTAELRRLLGDVQTGRVPSPKSWIRLVPTPGERE